MQSIDRFFQSFILLCLHAFAALPLRRGGVGE
jgi:hypothetical protein